MAAVGGQVRFDGLFVSNIRKNVIVNGELAVLRRRNGQAALGGQCEQARRLQGDCLAACVGTCYGENLRSFRQFQIQWDDVAAAAHLAELRHQQRMAGLMERQIAAEIRKMAAVGDGPAGDGRRRIQFGDNALVDADAVRRKSHLSAENGENPPHFIPLFDAQAGQIVAPAERLVRFDEHRLAAVGHVVDDAGQRRAGVLPDGNDETAVAHRDEPFLRVVTDFIAFDKRVQIPLDFRLRRDACAAEFAELRGGGIKHGAV